MSGNNIARQVQRRMVRDGKMRPDAYRKLRRPVDVDAAEETVNVLRQLDGLSPRTLEYHPTKGYRTFRRPQ